MSSLGEEFPEEQKRVREVLARYKQLGSVGNFGAVMIEAALQDADKAIISGDIVAMIQSYKELKSIE